MFLCSVKSSHFVSNLKKNSRICDFKEVPLDYFNITWGGLPNLLQYYNRGGGVYRDPKLVLRNKWTAPCWAERVNRIQQPSPRNVSDKAKSKHSFSGAIIPPHYQIRSRGLLLWDKCWVVAWIARRWLERTIVGEPQPSTKCQVGSLSGSLNIRIW